MTTDVWEIVDNRSGRRMISVAYPSRQDAEKQIAAWNRKGTSPEGLRYMEARALHLKEQDDD